MKKESKTLFRSKKDRIFLGVCGGLAEFFDMDSTLVRVIFVLLILFSGVGIIIYILLAIFVPEEDAVDAKEPEIKEKLKDFGQDVKDKVNDIAKEIKTQNREIDYSKTRNIVAVILIFIGVGLLLQQFLNWNIWDIFLPLIIILLGVAIIFKK
ncbi:MAG TPA: PspC domain-containing protein [Patescibacteria group bacterium]|nr:PspC domain-containing protein [Patescibacteria group bacterium]